MALDPQQQIVTIGADSAGDAALALLGHLDRGPRARIVSVALDTDTYANSGTTRTSTIAVTMVAVIAYEQTMQPGQIPPIVHIEA